MTTAHLIATISHSDRVKALQIGAAVLQSRWPNVQAQCLVRIDGNVRDAHAALDWPGIVRVTDRWTGKVFAQSIPGYPFDLDGEVTP